MPTTVQLKFQSPNADTLDNNFQKDWSAANDDYRAAIKAGFSSDDAKRLYLDPVQAKWQIVASSPSLQSDKKRFNQFDSEFQDAYDQNIQNYNAYSRDNPTPETTADSVKILDVKNQPETSDGSAKQVPSGTWAATQSGSIEPFFQKWSAGARLPVPTQADPLLAEKEGALSEAREGFDPQDILQGHPQVIFSDPSFLGRFNTATSEGYKARQKETAAQTKKSASPDLLKLGNRRAAFQRLETQGSGTPGTVNTNLPPILKALYDAQIGALNEQLTNGAPAETPAPAMDMVNPPVRFQPSAGAQPQGGSKVADENIIRQALQQAGGNKESARQWLQDNGYQIPTVQ